jgi:hypothetical protein
MRRITAGHDDGARAAIARGRAIVPGKARAVGEDDRGANPRTAQVDCDDGSGGQGETSGNLFDRERAAILAAEPFRTEKPGGKPRPPSVSRRGSTVLDERG